MNSCFLPSEMDCPPLPVWDGLRVDGGVGYNTWPIGSQANISCPHGIVFESTTKSSETVRCTSTGTWHPPVKQCSGTDPLASYNLPGYFIY